MSSQSMSGKRAKTALLITLIIAVSKLVGMVRDMLINYTFGQSLETSVYSIANKYLTNFTLLFSVGIASTFIPIYTKTRLKQGERYANAYANYIVNLYIVVGLAISLLAYACAPFFARLIWRGADSAAVAVPLIADYARLMMPFAVFYAVSGVFVNILNANERFVPEQLMGFALSALLMGVCLTGGSVRELSLMTGVTGALQVAILIPFLWGVYRYQPRLGIGNEKVSRTFRLALPAMISMGFDEINSLSDSFFATAINDAAGTVLTNSYRIVMLVLGIVAVPLTTITFPLLSQSAARGDKKGIIDSIKQCTEILAIIILPITSLIALFSNEVVGILYQRGEFGPQDTALVAAALVPYILGVYGFSVRNFQTRVFYAMQRTRPPMIIGLFCVTLNIALDWFLYPKWGVPGLTFATAVSGSVSALLMLSVLRRYLGKMRIKSTLNQLVRIATATIVCVAVAWFCRDRFPLQDATLPHRLLRLAVSGGTGLVAYFVCVEVLRVRQVALITSSVRAKFRNEK